MAEEQKDDPYGPCDQPPACAHCVFMQKEYYGRSCGHWMTRRWSIIHGYRWVSLQNARTDETSCGHDGRYYEPLPPPKTFVQTLRSLFQRPA